MKRPPASSSLPLLYTLTMSSSILSRSLNSGLHITCYTFTQDRTQSRSKAGRLPALGKPSGWPGSLRADLSPDSTVSMLVVLISICFTLTSWDLLPGSSR